ncbi:hypothetical protein ACJ41O_010967 [Fusarium nematophilum]
MELLPQTILDTITTASRPGLEYIWIDSLCIMQDDEEEKLVDIAHMADIYSQADFTISASSAAAVADGFLQDHPVPQPKMPFSPRYLSQTGAEGRVTMCAEPTPLDVPDPINSRAWTFQERVLSPRLVEFPSTQIRWRCNSIQKCHAGCPPESPWKRLFETPQIATSNRLYQMDALEAFTEWNGLVRAYSDRSLSYPPDKLIAFSTIFLWNMRIYSVELGIST